MFSQAEMERAFIGGMLIVNGSGTSLADPEDFTRPDMRLAFCTIRDGHVAAPLFAERIGPAGAALYAELLTHGCSGANLKPFADMLRRQRQLRDIRANAIALAEQSQAQFADPAALARDAIERFQGASTAAPDLMLGLRSMSDVMAMEELTGQSAEVRTMIPELDREAHISGGTLNIIAARPGQGKSAMMLDWAASAARQGFQVLLFSLEMTLKDIRRRLWAMFPDGPESVAGLPLWIQEPFIKRPQVGHLVMFAAEFCRTMRDRPTVIIVDYAQIVAPNRYWQTRREQVGEVIRELKSMALALDVPVIAGAQLSRSVEQRGPKARPQLSDLKEAGEIEEIADLVCLLHRPRMDSTKVYLGVAKNRHGPGHFSVRMMFHPDRARFVPATNESEDRSW